MPSIYKCCYSIRSQNFNFTWTWH